MRGGPLVLAGDRVRVVAGHVGCGPTHPGLLLALRDHRVEGGRLKVTKRVQVDVRRGAQPPSSALVKAWVTASGYGGVPPPGSAENTKPSSVSATPASFASRSCAAFSDSSSARVPASTATDGCWSAFSAP